MFINKTILISFSILLIFILLFTSISCSEKTTSISTTQSMVSTSTSALIVTSTQTGITQPTIATTSTTSSITSATKTTSSTPTTSAISSTTTSTTFTNAPTIQLQWLGQSAFLITSSQGTKILIDPLSAGTGYALTPIDSVDAVLVSHEHSDHNNVGLAVGSPLIIRGLTSTGWNTIDQRIKDIHVYSISPVVPVYHDNQQGAQRGRNTIFILEVDGLRLAHLGDLGHVLTTEMIQAIGTVDVVLVPVGGSYTIDAAAATQVINQLNPCIVVPMHYKTPVMQANWSGLGVEPFLENKIVERIDSTKIMLSRSTLPTQTTVVVLNYE